MTLEELIEYLDERHAEALDRIAHLEQRLERMFRYGKVTDVDGEKHQYRQELGQDVDGTVKKSDWMDYSQMAGGRKSHSMPSEGEKYLAIFPDGNLRSGLGIPAGWSDPNPAPSTDPKADVDVRGSTKDTTTETSRKIEVGGASIEITDGKIVMICADLEIRGS